MELRSLFRHVSIFLFYSSLCFTLEEYVSVLIFYCPFFPDLLKKKKKINGVSPPGDKYVLLMLEILIIPEGPSVLQLSLLIIDIFFKLKCLSFYQCPRKAPRWTIYKTCWNTSWDIAVCIQYVMQYSCFLKRGKKFFFWEEEKISIAKQRIEHNNTSWMRTFWKGEMHILTFKSQFLLCN